MTIRVFLAFALWCALATPASTAKIPIEDTRGYVAVFEEGDGLSTICEQLGQPVKQCVRAALCYAIKVGRDALATESGSILCSEKEMAAAYDAARSYRPGDRVWIPKIQAPTAEAKPPPTPRPRPHVVAASPKVEPPPTPEPPPAQVVVEPPTSAVAVVKTPLGADVSVGVVVPGSPEPPPPPEEPATSDPTVVVVVNQSDDENDPLPLWEWLGFDPTGWWSRLNTTTMLTWSVLGVGLLILIFLAVGALWRRRRSKLGSKTDSLMTPAAKRPLTNGEVKRVRKESGVAGRGIVLGLLLALFKWGRRRNRRPSYNLWKVTYGPGYPDLMGNGATFSFIHTEKMDHPNGGTPIPRNYFICPVCLVGGNIAFDENKYDTGEEELKKHAAGHLRKKETSEAALAVLQEQNLEAAHADEEEDGQRDPAEGGTTMPPPQVEEEERQPPQEEGARPSAA